MCVCLCVRVFVCVCVHVCIRQLHAFVHVSVSALLGQLQGYRATEE